MDDSKIFNGGLMLHPFFWDARWNASEKEKYIRETLGLDPKKMILVLGTGAAGANNHLAFLNALKNARAEVQVLTLCGNSEKTFQDARAWSKKNPQIPVKAIAYTQDMAKIMQAASAIVARPGTGTTSEAILSNCPILFNGIGGIMPQEWITLKYARKYGFANVIHHPGDLPKIISSWIQNPQKLQEVKEKMKRVRTVLHPRVILEKIASLKKS
jgi:processive 1,2-diacylglycerol beta-glucosyltransferase